MSLGVADTNTVPAIFRAIPTRLQRMVRRAGLNSWPKLFQNLRSTREYNGLEKLGAPIRWIRCRSDKDCRRRIHGKDATEVFSSV